MNVLGIVVMGEGPNLSQSGSLMHTKCYINNQTGSIIDRTTRLLKSVNSLTVNTRHRVSE